MSDIRAEVARYYDLNPEPPADIPFCIVNRWGGYAGEPYGERPELVVQFQ